MTREQKNIFREKISLAVKIVLNNVTNDTFNKINKWYEFIMQNSYSFNNTRTYKCIQK